DPCAAGLPGPAISITSSGWLLNTDVGTLTNGAMSIALVTSVVTLGDGSTALMIATDGLTITAAGVMRTSGALPAVIAVHGSATIDGTIDVSGTMLGGGAGADPAVCIAGTVGGTATSSAGGSG